MRKVFKGGITFCCILILMLRTVCAQVYRHLDYLTTKEGLSSNYITGELATTNGYLWITSNLGLSRYDGRKFIDIDIDIPTAEFKDIIKMIEYPENVIWLILRETKLVEENFGIKKIYCYDIIHDIIVPLDTLFPNLPFDTNEISFIENPKYREGILLVTNQQKLFHLTTKSCIKIVETEQESLKIANIDPSGNYWWITGQNLWKQESGNKVLIDTITLGNKRIQTSRDHIFLDHFPESDVISVIKYPFGKEVYKTEDFPSYSHLADGITHINPFGAIVVPSNDSTYIEDEDTRQCIPLKELSNNGSYRLHRGLYTDNEATGIFTGDNGIHIFSIQNLPFRKMQHDKKTASCRGISLINDSTLIANSYLGQLVIDRQSATVNRSDFLADFTGYGISKSSSKDFWNGTHLNRILYQSSYLKDAKNYFFQSLNGDKPKAFQPFYHEKTNSLLVGTSKGLFEYDTARDSVVLFKKGVFATDLVAAYIYNFQSQNDSLWICTDKGLFLKTPSEGIERHYTYAHKEIIDVHIEDANTYWLATLNNGIFRWNRSTNEIEAFNTSKGLSNNAPTCIYPDYLGNL
ncbi:MAG: hypothetical protein AAF849_17565 [Bacteroidota bacterium]